MEPLRRLLNPARHVHGDAREVAVLVVFTAALALGAIVAMIWAAGFDKIHHRLVEADWWWMGAAAFGEMAAYLGYVIAYREVASVEDGPELTLPNVASLVVTGFAPFVALGGF